MMVDIDDDILYALLSSFADDTRTSKEVTNLIDSFMLQHNLNNIYKWAERNNMQLNDLKFEHIHYGKNKELVSFTYSITRNGLKIEKKHVKDLGVIMSEDCSFSEHINQLSAKLKKSADGSLEHLSLDRRYQY